MNGLVTTAAILAAMAAIVVLFRLAVRRPRGLSCVDPPGLRSVAVFFGDDPELFADDKDDEPFVGVRFFAALCDDLAAGGIEIPRRGHFQYAQQAVCVAGQKRFSLVLERVEDRWVASVEWVPETSAQRRHVSLTQEVFAPPDSPGLRRLLTALDARLRAHPALGPVRWYRKERWMAEDASEPGDGPIDGGARPAQVS